MTGLGCSPFVRHYSGNRCFLSLPPGTQMYHFPGFPPHALCVQAWVTRRYPRWVPPFGDPCFKARLRLHTAYRSLPRPSSASGAKASAIRPYHLDGIIFALCGFQRSSLSLSASSACTKPPRPEHQTRSAGQAENFPYAGGLQYLSSSVVWRLPSPGREV